MDAVGVDGSGVKDGLVLAKRGFSAHTSTGSSMARSMNSIPLRRSLAIFASVPASTMTLAMTLCACRLYSGMIVRRPCDVDDVEELNEAVEL